MSDGDREWYCVEGSGGTALPMDALLMGAEGHRATNYEQALDRATELAPRYDEALTVVRYQRTEVTKVSREIAIRLEDVSSDTAKA